jgi:hypothetical protein
MAGIRRETSPRLPRLNPAVAVSDDHNEQVALINAPQAFLQRQVFTLGGNMLHKVILSF